MSLQWSPPALRLPATGALRNSRALVWLMLSVHGVLLAYGAWQHSPVHAEVQQLPAGLYHWEYRRFDLAEVNPPLVRLVAALPVMWMSPDVDWRGHEAQGFTRDEYEIGRRFVENNGADCRRLFFAARVACIPFSLLGAFFCWRWGKRLYGDVAGLLSAALWCFSPSVLGHGQFVSADIAAAAMSLVATWYIRDWLRAGTWTKALISGAALGAALLTKFTLLVLLPLIPLWATLIALDEPFGSDGDRRRSRRFTRYGLQCTAVLGIALYVINLVYCFDTTPFRPHDVFFKSRVLRPLGANPLPEAESGTPVRSFRDVWIPLPASYLRGIDQQWFDFEAPSPSYLRGQWKLGGWWYYYLYALSIKTPVGTLALALLALATFAVLRRCPGDRPRWPDEFIPLSLLISILVVVSSQDNMSCHLRYIFPLLGLFFVLCSRSVRLRQASPSWAPRAISACLACSTVSVFSQYPHLTGYFNELVGARNGHHHLNYSNLDWGQDLFYLKRWYDDHRAPAPLFLASEALYNPEAVGIDYLLPFKVTDDRSAVLELTTSRSGGPRPGWYAVSRNHLILRDGEYRYLHGFTPIETVGSAISIYHLTLQDVNAARRELGFPLLPSDWETRSHDGKLMAAGFSRELAGTIASFRARPFRARIAVLAFRYSSESDDKEEQEICRILENGISCDSEIVTVDHVQSGGLSGYDTLIVPGGSSELMARSLGRVGSDAIRQFVASGGGYVGICAGSFLATDRFEFCLRLVEASVLDGTCDTLQGYSVRMTDRGEGSVAVKMNDLGQAVFATGPSSLSVLYTGGPVFQDDVMDQVPAYVSLATYLSETWRCEKQRWTMIQSPACIAAPFGRGRVLLFGFHPELQPETHDLLLSAITAVAGNADRSSE